MIAAKLISILLIFIGEALSIYAEVISARIAQSGVTLDALGKASAYMVVGGIILIGGYVLGYVAYKHNIWPVSAISLITILLTEPIIDYLIFHTLPDVRVSISFLLAFIGMLIVLSN